MCVIDASTDEGRIRERNLPFEGFLEALVRLATVLPLPTDAAIAEAELTHAGAYMAQLEGSGDDTAIETMVAEQECEWGDVPDATRGGSMPRRLHHLVDIIVRKIKMPKEADEPLEGLTRKEFRHWAIRSLGASEQQIPDTWAKEKQAGEQGMNWNTDRGIDRFQMRGK